MFITKQVKHEEELFQVVVKWVDKDVANRKQFFPRLFKRLRLNSISEHYLATTVRKHVRFSKQVFKASKFLILAFVYYGGF